MFSGTSHFRKSALPLSAFALASALCVCAPSAYAQDDAHIAPAQATTHSAAEVDTPWYDAFTLSLRDDIPPALDELPTVDWESGNGRWGIALGIREERNEPLELDDVSARAFLNVGDRFRFGGQVRFTAPQDDLFLMETEDEERAPEIKFESSLRF